MKPHPLTYQSVLFHHGSTQCHSFIGLLLFYFLSSHDARMCLLIGYYVRMSVTVLFKIMNASYWYKKRCIL